MSNWTFIGAEKYPDVIRLLFKPEERGEAISLMLHVKNAQEMIAEVSKLLPRANAD